MIRKTKININGQQVECRYLVQDGEITYLHLRIDNDWADSSELLDLPWVYESLDAHHKNLLEEDCINED